MMRIIFIMSLSMCTLYFTYTEDVYDYQVILNNWISENKSASTQEIASFIESFIPTQESIENTYNTLYIIISSYPDNIIPSSVYLLFAQIASLKFDFETSSTMYYAVYSRTKNPKYLLDAAIQEFQRGNFDISSIYLREVLSYNTDDYKVRSSAYILQSELLLVNNSIDFAYSYIETAVNILSTEQLTPAILYQYFRLAKFMHDDEALTFIQESLLKHFENSLEAQMVSDTYISPLPLPSLLFNAAPYTLENMASENNTEHLLSQETPSFGYQIGVFSILENAYAALAYFSPLIENSGFNLATPILTKRNIENENYYQIIIPLNSNTEIQETEILSLKQLGVEGFVISHN